MESEQTNQVIFSVEIQSTLLVYYCKALVANPYDTGQSEFIYDYIRDNLRIYIGNAGRFGLIATYAYSTEESYRIAFEKIAWETYREFLFANYGQNTIEFTPIPNEVKKFDPFKVKLPEQECVLLNLRFIDTISSLARNRLKNIISRPVDWLYLRTKYVSTLLHFCEDSRQEFVEKLLEKVEDAPESSSKEAFISACRKPEFLDDKYFPKIVTDVKIKALWEMRAVNIAYYNYRFAIIRNRGGAPEIIIRDPYQQESSFTPKSFFESEPEKSVFLGLKTVKKETVEIWKPAAKLWYASAEAERYRTAQFLPGSKPPPDVYNIWQGWPKQIQNDRFVTINGIMRDKWRGYAEATDSFPTIFEYFRDALANGNDAILQYNLSWWADLFQNPTNPRKAAIALVSDDENEKSKGVGKTFLYKLAVSTIGERHCMMRKGIDAFTSSFNAKLAEKLFVMCDEVPAGIRKNEISDALKFAVNANDSELNEKFVKTYGGKLIFRTVFTMNKATNMPVEKDERRYQSQEMGTKFHRDGPFFKRLEAAIAGDEGTAFFNAMLARDISQWDCERDQVITKAFIRQRQGTAGRYEQAVRDLLEYGFLSSLRSIDIGGQDCIFNSGKIMPMPQGARAHAVKTHEIVKTLFGDDDLDQFRRDINNLAKELRPYCFARNQGDLFKEQLRIGGKNETVIWLPDRDIMRSLFENIMYKSAIEWPPADPWGAEPEEHREATILSAPFGR
jgi:hypothetical protein